jgi:Fur family ferric uptake transcriptional regulator
MARTKKRSADALYMIRGAGLRATAARVRVLNTLLAAEHALTHNEIEDAVGVYDGVIERVTLYRVLDWLVSNGLAHKITGADRVWRFNAQPDPIPDHAHFTCTHCGQVTCLENPSPVPTLKLPRGFRLTQADVSLQGLCPHCSH